MFKLTAAIFSLMVILGTAANHHDAIKAAPRPPLSSYVGNCTFLKDKPLTAADLHQALLDAEHGRCK